MLETARSTHPARDARRALLWGAGLSCFFALHIACFFGWTGELTCTRVTPARVDCAKQPLMWRLPVWPVARLSDVRSARWEQRDCDAEGCTVIFEAKTATGTVDLQIGPFFTGSAAQADHINAFIQHGESSLVVGTEGFVGTRACLLVLGLVSGGLSAVGLWLLRRARRTGSEPPGHEPSP